MIRGGILYGALLGGKEYRFLLEKSPCLSWEVKGKRWEVKREGGDGRADPVAGGATSPA